jgi:hypothetical protein
MKGIHPETELLFRVELIHVDLVLRIKQLEGQYDKQ